MLTPEEIELTMAPNFTSSTDTSASNSESTSASSSNPLTEASSHQDLLPSFAATMSDDFKPNEQTGAVPRPGGLSRSLSRSSVLTASASQPNFNVAANSNGGTGTKTPRKNVQWAASTKGEGPMNAAAEAHTFRHESHRHRHDGNSHSREREGDGHMHFLDEGGRDPKAFQTLTHALEQHQSGSRDNSPSSSHRHPHSTHRPDFASNENGDRNMNAASSSGPSSRPELGYRRSEPPRLTSLPPNPFSLTNGNGTTINRDSNPFASGNRSEAFTPTTLSPIHSDAETETDEYTSPERSVPGEAIIESTEMYGLPRPLPASAANAAGTGGSGRGNAVGRFSLFPFRSGSFNKDEGMTLDPLASSSAGGRVSDGAFGTTTVLDAEEEERRRVERRATRLVRAHARGFQFLEGFKGNKAMQRLAPEDIDPDAPLPRRPTRFSRAAEAARRTSRRRPKSAPPANDESRESSSHKDGNRDRHKHLWFGGWGRRSEDEDVEDSAAHAETKNAPLALGSGVLAALLTLYDRSSVGTRSGFSTPGDRTPSGSEPGSPVESLAGQSYFGHGRRRDREKEKDNKGDYFGKHTDFRREHSREAGDEHDSMAEKQTDELQRINTRLNAGNNFDNERERERFEREKESERKLESGGGSSAEQSPLTPPHPLYAQKAGARSLQSLKVKQSFSELTRTMSSGIERIKEKTSPTRLTTLPLSRLPLIGGDARHPTARSGAGVFGTLITSTGNLTGVAAPVPSQIAPNPKKPGFHLSRYSWSDETIDPEAEDVLKRAKKRTGASTSGSRTPGNSPRSSIALSMSEPKFPGLGIGGGSDSLLALGLSKSAPTTPAGEQPPSLVVLGTESTPSPASDGSPASETPLMIASKNHLDLPVIRTSGHSPSKSLDSATLPGEKPAGAGHARGQSDTFSLTTIPTRGSAATSITLNSGGIPGKKKWAGILKDFQRYGEGRSGAATPDTMSDPGDEKHRRWGNASSSAEEKRKRKRKKAEIFITRHVAEIMQRQEFILKLTRAFMMFGAPTHRLPAQIQATARVLDMDLNCMYLPDVMLISFDDAATSTSNIKFIRQSTGLALGKLQDAYNLYWKVIHDEIGVGEASRALDVLMQQRTPYPTWQLALFGGFCSATICQVSFSGSFIDALIAFPLGMLLVFVQILSVRNELYSNVFEITITTFLSFMSAVFAGTHHFCYSAVASGSIVLILPGFLVLNGSLEVSSRNIVSGAVRLCYAVVYSLFLGFGLSIGGTLYETVTGKAVSSPEDYTCGNSHHANGPWYQRTPSGAWAFLTVPLYSLFLSLRNHAPWWRKELLVTVAISCVGWTCNHFASIKFPNRNDVSSAIGAFVVGFIANLYGRFFSGNAFVIMITGIFFQLPSGLGNGGLITFASQNNTAGTTTSYLSGFKTALQLISVAMGLTVGLGISLVVLFPIQSRKRAGGIFSL